MRFAACGHPLRMVRDGDRMRPFCVVCWSEMAPRLGPSGFAREHVRDALREEWRGREDEANACEGMPGAALRYDADEGVVNEALAAIGAHLAGGGYTRAEVDETIARICPPSSRTINFRLGQTIACRGEAVHATDHGTYILIDEALPSQRVKRHVVDDGVTEQMMLGVW